MNVLDLRKIKEKATEKSQNIQSKRFDRENSCSLPVENKCELILVEDLAPQTNRKSKTSTVLSSFSLPDFFLKVLFSFFSLFLFVVFVWSTIVGAYNFSNWLPKALKPYESKEKIDPTITIPEFIIDLKENEKNGENRSKYEFKTNYTILRIEKISEFPERGIGSVPTLKWSDWESFLKDLSTKKVFTLDYFLRSLFFKENLPDGSFSIIFTGGYSEHLKAAKDLRKMGVEAAFFIPARKIGKPGFLTWDEISEIKDMRHTIGVSGFSYTRLGNLSLPEQMEEIANSRTMIFQKLEFEPKYFYYPFGSYSVDTLPILKQNGFVAAFTSNESTLQDLEKTFELSTVTFSSS